MPSIKGPIGGLVFSVLSNSGINGEEKFALPKGAKGHLVMALGWDEQRDWVRLVSEIYHDVKLSSGLTLSGTDYQREVEKYR